MRAQRRSRWGIALFTILSLSVLPLSSFAAAAPGPTSSRFAPGHAQPLSSSVIVEDANTVSAAGTDLTSYTADRYIVTYTASVTDVAETTSKLAKAIGFTPSIVYTERIRGFAAKLTDQQLKQVKTRREVAGVEADEVIPAPSAYGMPTGVSRIGALANATAKINGVDQRVNVDVAVIDTGIDVNQPDLNVAATFDCTKANGTARDEVGHGTHVSGTIGALDNGQGVTGVAPGARIWAIKIFTAQGGTKSWAICGLETAADHGADIDVANMSWGWYENNADGSCSSTTIHQAICDAFNAGITLVDAAGNESRNAANSVPATFSQVITVSALSDSDGQPGGKGPNTSYGCDDCLAIFSNFGPDIDLAAPGVDILSTCPLYLSCNADTGLEIESGTSMASPHVAGAAALYIASHGRVGPSAVRSALIAKSDPTSMKNDPDGIHEPILYAGDLNPSCGLNLSSAPPQTALTLTCTGFRASEIVTVYQDKSGGAKLGSFTASSRGNGSLAFKAPAATRGTHQVIPKGQISRRSTSIPLRIAAKMTLSPTSGKPSSSVAVALSGFGASESVTVKFDPGKSTEKTLKSGVTTSSIGSASVSIKIPSTSTIGKHKIEATGSQGAKVTLTFTVLTSTSSVSQSASLPTATASPTATATAAPSESPTAEPTQEPTQEPTATDTPTQEPTATATEEPTEISTSVDAEGTPTE